MTGHSMGEAEHYTFGDAAEAWQWSVEVLRRRRLVKLSKLWQQVRPELELLQAWEGEKRQLPSDEWGRLSLALQVQQAMDVVQARHAPSARLLHLWAWGDWAEEGRLRAALAIQEQCRREGRRVRLAYRYSYAQLAGIYGWDRKRAWREVQQALTLLHAELQKLGLLDGAPQVATEQVATKVVAVQAFRPAWGSEEEA